MEKIKVAFICIHNSCRSQIAEALCKYLAYDKIESYSAGTHIKDSINKDAVRIMKNLYNIDMELTQCPKLLKDIPNVDIVITMGCGVVCPSIPCKSMDDWGLDDPSGKSDEEFEKIIQRIYQNILMLKEKL